VSFLFFEVAPKLFAKSGHPLLQGAAVAAARQARFTPAKYNGERVKVVGVIQYTFQ
jgi:outer membrane biosynthesis protein TonB